MPDYNLDYYDDYDPNKEYKKILFQPSRMHSFEPNDELTHISIMRGISNVADVLFEPSLTSPHCTGTFADGQRISFNPYTVDWVQLERTCRFWSHKYITNQFGEAIANSHKNVKSIMDKLQLSSEYGKFAV